MSYEKIANSPHKIVVDKLIEEGRSPTLIREELVRQEIDQYSLSEISEYVHHYYTVVLKRAGAEQSQLFTELAGSLPVVLAGNINQDVNSLTYKALLELDVLRAEKLIQTLFEKHGSNPYLIKEFSQLAKVKQGVIKSLVELLEYRQAIQAAREAQFSASHVNMEKLRPYLERLSDTDRHIALDVLNLVMDVQLENNKLTE